MSLILSFSCTFLVKKWGLIGVPPETFHIHRSLREPSPDCGQMHQRPFWCLTKVTCLLTVVKPYVWSSLAPGAPLISLLKSLESVALLYFKSIAWIPSPLGILGISLVLEGLCQRKWGIASSKSLETKVVCFSHGIFMWLLYIRFIRKSLRIKAKYHWPLKNTMLKTWMFNNYVLSF